MLCKLMACSLCTRNIYCSNPLFSFVIFTVQILCFPLQDLTVLVFTTVYFMFTITIILKLHCIVRGYMSILIPSSIESEAQSPIGSRHLCESAFFHL
jgi:hypothetical protein